MFSFLATRLLRTHPVDAVFCFVRARNSSYFYTTCLPSTEALLYIIFLITQHTPPPICFYSENKFTLTPVRSSFERFEVLVGRMKGI
jgi:hypothetical protein